MTFRRDLSSLGKHKRNMHIFLQACSWDESFKLNSTAQECFQNKGMPADILQKWTFQANLQSIKLPSNWRYSCRHPQKMISKSWNLPANWRYSCRQPPKMNLSGQPPKHKSAFKLKVFLQTSSLNEPFKPTVSPLRQLNECLPGGLWP